MTRYQPEQQYDRKIGVLNFVIAHQKEHHRGPNMQAIADEFKMGFSSAQYYVNQLQAEHKVHKVRMGRSKMVEPTYP